MIIHYLILFCRHLYSTSPVNFNYPATTELFRYKTMELTKTLEEDIKKLKTFITYFPDFPIPGIIYKDVLSVLNHGDSLQLLAKILKQIALQLQGKVDCIVMLQSRGFMIAPLMALYLNVPCVPVAKKGNLPGPVLELSYALEYGEDTIAVQLNSIKEGQRILLVDDFLATGGTLEAASKIIKKSGAKIEIGFVLMEKCELEGRKRLDFPVISLISE